MVGVSLTLKAITICWLGKRFWAKLSLNWNYQDSTKDGWFTNDIFKISIN